MQAAGAAAASLVLTESATVWLTVPSLVPGVLCFAIVLAAIGYGIYLIVASS